jgi:hypothetical protein
MKWIKADLVADVVGSYDQTKTTIQGRVASKVINTQTVLGPPLTKFIDVFTDSGQNPTSVYCTENGRLFVLTAPVNNTPTAQSDSMAVLLYDFNFTTGAYTYTGRINLLLPNVAASVHTIRGFKVIDTGTTGWKIFVATSATVAINGGLFLANNVDLADFVLVGFPNIDFATGTNQKAMYLLQDPSNIGTAQLNIASVGMVLDESNDRIYVHNGIAATHQYYVYDTAIAPAMTVNSVTVSVASPGIVSDAGHTFENNAPVVFTAGTLPTGLTVGTVYFVRNPVAGVSYELSTTSGGASINTTGSPSVGASITRAWGTTGSNWIHKTGNLPALTGTLLANDSEDFAIPVAAPINGGTLNGNSCVFLSTSSSLYLGLLSELTSGAITWPSLTTSNILGATNEITAPTAVFAAWSNILDSATYTTNTSKFITKQVENNVIRSNTGELNNQYYEATPLGTVSLGLVTVTGLDIAGGWLFTSGGTTGQRGIIAANFASDSFYDFSYIVTKVLNFPNSKLRFTNSWEQLWQDTGNIKVQYRNSGFGTISGGWIDLNGYEDLQSAIISSNQIQFKILFNMQSEGSSSPAQINELLIGAEANNGISEHWEFSDEYSVNTSPSRSAFRLKLAFASTVPQLYYRAYDLSDALLVNHNTVTNAANFEYSTDNGMTWLPLGTIPNTVGTLVRYTFTSPPGVDIRPGLKES